MSHKLWALLGRLVYRIGGIVALPLFLNGTSRTRVALIDNETGRILLVRVWIGDQKWDLVGGGVEAREDLVVSAVREVKEETGLTIDQSQLVYVADKQNKSYMAQFKTHLFIAYVDEYRPTSPKPEILEAEWHSLDNLPIDRNTDTIKLIMSKHRARA